MADGVVIMKDRSRLYLWETGSATLADKIGKATEIGEQGSDVEEIDMTTLESDAKENEPGFDDYGSMTVTQLITADELTTMNAFRASKDILKWGLVVDDKTGTPVLTQTGECWVKSVKRGALTVGGRLEVTSELRITGEPVDTWTEPTV